MRKATAVLATLAVAGVMTACDSGENANQGDRAVLPCEDVAFEGATITDKYLRDGCFEGDEILEPSFIECDDGSKLAMFNDELYGMSGEDWVAARTPAAADDPDFQQMKAACTTE